MTRGRSVWRGWGWGLEATADDQRPVRWEGRWGGGLELEATADDQRQRCVLWGEVRTGSGSWSQRGWRVKVKGLRSSRVLPVKMGVELVQLVWKRWVAADSCRFCLVLCGGL